MKKIHVPLKYVPHSLTKKNKDKQIHMLQQSRRAYQKGRYVTRKQVKSYPHQTSKHVIKARRMYDVSTIGATRELSKATGCSTNALQQIIRKGAGAYYSSGSRPNQTAQSWGIARLASAITGGKSAAVDFRILEKGCDSNMPAFRLAQSARKKHQYGQRKTRKITI
jgi:Family of unknown function (DUF5824)